MVVNEQHPNGAAARRHSGVLGSRCAT
jgi:hypothetical protein